MSQDWKCKGMEDHVRVQEERASEEEEKNQDARQATT